jgi:hypothetical protein
MGTRARQMRGMKLSTEHKHVETHKCQALLLITGEKITIFCCHDKDHVDDDDVEKCLLLFIAVQVQHVVKTIIFIGIY